MTTTALVTGVDFVCVPAQDIEASDHFYGTVLGLPFHNEWVEMPAKKYQAGDLKLFLGDETMGLLEQLTLAVMDPTAFGQEFRPHGLPIALQVEDVPAAKERLEAEGVRFVTDIIDSGVCHQAIFVDPAGNSLGIHHRYAARD